MSSLPPLIKPKLHFDTAVRPSHVTFDDGKKLRRNIPWLHYVVTDWDYDEPDLLKVQIGDWVVLLRGHNLSPLYLAIEDHTLARIRALPDLEQDRDRDADTFVCEIRFAIPPAKPSGGNPPGQIEFALGG